jgi:hypothetical protein
MEYYKNKTENNLKLKETFQHGSAKEIIKIIIETVNKKGFQYSDYYKTFTLWSENDTELTNYLFRNTHKNFIFVIEVVISFAKFFKIELSENRIKELKTLFKRKISLNTNKKKSFKKPIPIAQNHLDYLHTEIREVNYQYKNNELIGTYKKIIVDDEVESFKRKLKLFYPFESETIEVIKHLSFFVGEDKIRFLHSPTTPHLFFFDNDVGRFGGRSHIAKHQQTYLEEQKNRKFYVGISGVNSDSESNLIQTSNYRNIYYSNLRDVSQNAKIKDKRIAKPYENFQTPITFLSDRYNPQFSKPKEINKVFIAEGIKDFFTTFNELIRKGEKNFVVLLSYGLSEFQKNIEFANETFNNANIYLIVDDDYVDDVVGKFEFINGIYSKQKKNIQKKLFYLDWDSVSTIERSKKSDITDYVNIGYKLSFANFREFNALFTEEEIKKFNFRKEVKSFGNGERYFSEIVEKNSELKNILFNSKDDLILKAPTGSGKSHFIKNNLKTELSKNSNEIVKSFAPLTKLSKDLIRDGKFSDIRQILDDYQGEFLFNGFEYTSFHSSTIQKLGNISENDLQKEHFEFLIKKGISDNFNFTFILDESHLMNSITKKGYFYLLKLKEMFPKIRLILISATTSNLELIFKDFKVLHLNTTKMSFQNYNEYLLPITNKNGKLEDIEIAKKTIEIVKNGGVPFIYLNSDKSQLITKELLKEKNIKVKIFNQSTKVDFEDFNWNKYDVYISTSVLEFGINIFESNITDVISKNLTVDKLTQFISRFRDRKKLKVHHFVHQNPNYNTQTFKFIYDVSDNEISINGINYKPKGKDIEKSIIDYIKNNKEKFGLFGGTIQKITFPKLQDNIASVHMNMYKNPISYGLLNSEFFVNDGNVFMQNEIIDDRRKEKTNRFVFKKELLKNVNFETISYSHIGKYEKSDINDDFEVLKTYVETTNISLSTTIKDTIVSTPKYSKTEKRPQGMELENIVSNALPKEKEDFTNFTKKTIDFAFKYEKLGFDLETSIENFSVGNAYEDYKHILFANAVKMLKEKYSTKNIRKTSFKLLEKIPIDSLSHKRESLLMVFNYSLKDILLHGNDKEKKMFFGKLTKSQKDNIKKTKRIFQLLDSEDFKDNKEDILKVTSLNKWDSTFESVETLNKFIEDNEILREIKSLVIDM